MVDVLTFEQRRKPKDIDGCIKVIWETIFDLNMSEADMLDSQIKLYECCLDVKVEIARMKSIYIGGIYIWKNV